MKSRKETDKSNKDVDFTEHYNKKRIHNSLFRWIDRKKIAILKKRFDGKNLKILDYGCGTGSISSKIQGCKIYGFDNNKNLLRIAKENGLDVKAGDFESIPFDNDFFDAVISIDTIEHVSSREKAFKEIKRVLKKDGELIIFTPAFNSPLWPIAEKAVTTITRKPAGHISPFTREALDYFISLHFSKAKKARNINFSLGLFASGSHKKKN
jgi:ubiquinone/menaquinone biosynthesis C-methylase UbiE